MFATLYILFDVRVTVANPLLTARAALAGRRGLGAGAAAAPAAHAARRALAAAAHSGTHAAWGGPAAPGAAR